MTSVFNKYFNFALIALIFSAVFSVSAQTRAYRVTDRQVNTVISRIETRTDTFRRQIERFYDRNETASREQLLNYVSDFENATDELRSDFGTRTSTSANVQDVLTRAAVIDSFIRNTRVPASAQTQWNLIRTDLNALAGYYNVNWDWNNVPTYPNYPNNNSRAYRVTDAQVQTLISRIETRTDTFRRQVDRYDSRLDSQVESYITDFENATDELRNNFNSRNSSAQDVQDVLTRAAVIDNFIRNNRVSTSTRTQWNTLRTDLDLLANYYTVSWNWNNVPTYPGNTGGQTGFDSRLTGTYRLNNSLSDNVSTVIDRAVLTIGNNENQRDRIRRTLERRLMAPELMVIEKRGQQVTLASSMSQQVSFNADGVSRTETNANGRSIQIRSTATTRDLTIDYTGDRMNDFYVSFMPMANGQLRVTRRVYLENRNETVTVNSVYDKIDQIARFDNIRYQDNNPDGNTTGGNYNNDFVIPNNTQIVATLDTALSTRTFSDGDRFQMTVTSPSQYQGAIIEGRVNGQKSGVVSGRASLAFDFDTIRLSNGQTYRFAGIVDQVREPDGDTISVNNEGQVRDSNQTKKTITRAGIGAALGAIIGAIAGGGQGAAIGAGIGAGAGAGTVILQGRDNLELPTGTQFTVTATAPVNR